MAGNKIQQIIEILTKGGKKSEKEIKGVSNSLGGLAKKAGIAAAAYFGTGMLLDAVKQSVTAFAQQEQAEKKLEFAAGSMSTSLIKQAQALQRVTRFGDEAIIAQQAYLASLGLTEDQIKDTISASLDLSAATGMSLESAVMNTSKTLSGMAGELGEKLGPGFRELSQEALKAGDGIKFIAEQFGGTAVADAETFTGQIDQMWNAFGDLQEELGERFAPTILNIVDGFKDWIELDPAEEALKEKNEFNNLLEVLKKANTETSTRKLAISKLKEEYSGYLGDLDIEKATLEDINKLQTEQIELMERRVTELMFAKEMETATQNRIAAEYKLFQLEQEASKERTFEISRQGMTKLDWDMQAIEKQKEIIQGYVDEENQIRTNQKAFLDGKNSTLDNNTDIVDSNEEVSGSYIKLNDLKVKNIGLTEDSLSLSTADTKNEEKKQEALIEQAKIQEAMNSSKEKMQIKIMELKKAEKVDDVKEALRTAYGMAGDAYRSLAKVPFVGPILGAAAATAALALGVKWAGKIAGFAQGGDFITNGPQMIMVGDNPSGKERVQVTPLGGDPNINGPQGANITMNVTGNVMTQDFVEGELLESIKEGLRVGGDIGL